MNQKTQKKFGDEIYGYTDILSVGDPVQVKRTEHISTVSEVITVPHCTIYRLDNPQWKLNWHFRVFLTKL